MERRITIQKIIKYSLFFFIAAIFVSIFSKSTSPIFSQNFIIDSGIFQVIGRGIVKGLVPYRDLFDHKGPILFYIQALGVLINKNYGIYILQIINIFVTIIFIEKLINLFAKNNLSKWIALTLTMVFYGLFFSEGNLSEEWSLSFILIALYLNLKGILTNKFIKFNHLITGITFAIISLIRVNNAASIVGFCIFYFFYLIIKRNFKELFKFIGEFIIGVLIVYIPIIIIFYKQNALLNMFEGTFLFNIIYGTKSEFSYFKEILRFISILPLIYLFAVTFSHNHPKRFKICMLIIILVNIIAVSAGYIYLHYYVILTPLIAILCAHINLSNIQITNKNVILNITCICCILVLYAFFYLYSLNNELRNYQNAVISEQEAQDLKNYIDDENSVLAYNVPAKIYMSLDILPAYKYFIFQTWHSQSNPQIAVDLDNQLQNGNIKYIITTGYSNLPERYSIKHVNNSFTLYELINK